MYFPLDAAACSFGAGVTWLQPSSLSTNLLASRSPAPAALGTQRLGWMGAGAGCWCCPTATTIPGSQAWADCIYVTFSPCGMNKMMGALPNRASPGGFWEKKAKQSRMGMSTSWKWWRWRQLGIAALPAFCPFASLPCSSCAGETKPAASSVPASEGCWAARHCWEGHGLEWAVIHQGKVFV